MTKIYLRIFIGFWFINVATVLLHTAWANWFNLEPNNELMRDQDNPYDKFAVRGLNATVDALIHWELAPIRVGVGGAPEWVFARVFIIDSDGNDLRNREIPPRVAEILSHLTLTSPFYRTSESEQSYAGRYILLPDGNNLRVISFSTPFHGRRVLWQFYIMNNWAFFLISILISGSACFFYARHMSRDFQRFRKATKDIAQGDLSVRLGPEFGNRHDEIAELSHDFDNMAQRLETSMREQKRLIKDVSHELRSPLARLQFALGIAQQRTESSEVREELEKVRNAADYLNDIITTILSFPTNDTDKWELHDAIDLNMLLETLAEDFREEADARDIHLDVTSYVDEALIATYSNTLIGVFENLIRNAMHYTGDSTTISIKIHREAGQYKVIVADQGPGVDENELKSIFEPFYRTDQARNRASGGYGLGLSIAQRTVQLHGGHILARNRSDGHGLAVEVSLPCAEFPEFHY